MKPLILAAALATSAVTAHADQPTYTPAPQAVLDATAGEATMDRVLPYMMLFGVAVVMILAGNN